RIDFVADERVGQRGRSCGPASGRSIGREVSSQHRGSRNLHNLSNRILPRRCSLIATKEEQFVFFDRAANASAKLITLQEILRGRKEIASVEFVISNEFKKRSVKLVRA